MIKNVRQHVRFTGSHLFLQKQMQSIVLRESLGGVGVFAICETKQWIVLCEHLFVLEVKRLPSLQDVSTGNLSRLKHVKTIRTRNFFLDGVRHFCFTDAGNSLPGLLLVAVSTGVFVLDVQKNKLVGKFAHWLTIEDPDWYSPSSISSHGKWACLNATHTLHMYSGSGADWQPVCVIRLRMLDPSCQLGSRVTQVAFTRSGKELLIIGDDKGNFIYNTETGEYMHAVDFEPLYYTYGACTSVSAGWVAFGVQWKTKPTLNKTRPASYEDAYCTESGVRVTFQSSGNGTRNRHGDITSGSATLIPGFGILARCVSGARVSKLVLFADTGDLARAAFSMCRFVWISCVVRSTLK